jgi:DNA-directed RNA polymerase subunit K/omega
MISNSIATIQEHQEIVGSRFLLAQVIMKRTNELLSGKPISKGLSAEFTPKRNRDIPNHRLAKVAMEELRVGKLSWNKLGEKINYDTDKIVEELSVVFGE